MRDPLKVAERTYVDVDIHKPENASRLASLSHLPASCVESADALQEQRKVYEERGVFSPAYLDAVESQLRGFDDKDLHERAKADLSLMTSLVNRFFHV